MLTMCALASQSTDDPDLRDRAFIYWRLLSTDPEGEHGQLNCHRETSWLRVLYECIPFRQGMG